MIQKTQFQKGLPLDDVFVQIQRAVRTLRMLPRVGIQERFSSWPEMLRSFFEAYNNEGSQSMLQATLRPIPTAQQITRMDQVIDWLTWVPPETSKIIWARAERYSWRKIAGMIGLAPKTCRERFRIGIVVISFKAANKGSYRAISSFGKRHHEK